MGLEDLTGSSKYINDLDDTNPSGSNDVISEGDNHIRGMKNVLLNTFPNITGTVNTDQDDLNNLNNRSSATIWGSDNDGASSGLDADLLDGKQSSAFVEPGDSPNFEKVNLNNNELGDHDNDGDVYFDSSSGIYVRASSVSGDQSGGNLLWSSGNFNAGTGLSVSYDSEDHPSLEIDSGGVGESEIAGNAVSRQELKYTTGVVSNSESDSSSVVEKLLPGGHWGFYLENEIELEKGGSGTAAVEGKSLHERTRIINNLNTTLDTGYDTIVELTAIAPDSGDSATVRTRQIYIQSSPPYDLGDGECGLFIEADVLRDGSVAGLYVAPDPVWATNGPTDISPDRIDRYTGKKYKQIRSPEVTRADLEAGRVSMEEYISAQKEAPLVEMEVTTGFKNSDMALFNHSLISGQKGTICLLDPVKTHDLLALHELGEDITYLIHKGYIKVDERVNRKGPPGVVPVSFKWANTKRV